MSPPSNLRSRATLAPPSLGTFFSGRNFTQSTPSTLLGSCPCLGCLWLQFFRSEGSTAWPCRSGVATQGPPAQDTVKQGPTSSTRHLLGLYTTLAGYSPQIRGSLLGRWLLNTHACVCSLSHVRLFVTPWTLARQAPLSMTFSRQEY